MQSKSHFWRGNHRSILWDWMKIELESLKRRSGPHGRSFGNFVAGGTVPATVEWDIFLVFLQWMKRHQRPVIIRKQRLMKRLAYHECLGFTLSVQDRRNGFAACALCKLKYMQRGVRHSLTFIFAAKLLLFLPSLFLLCQLLLGARCSIRSFSVERKQFSSKKFVKMP